MTKPSELQSLIGQEIGVSRWITIDQARIDAFARITEDEQFIHVDPERAKATPFGGTIAHGFLTLSLASAMSYDAVAPLEGVVMGVNYGFDSLRFLAPVPAGSNVRGRFRLLSAEDKGAQDGVTRWLLKHELTVEIEGGDKPALIAEWLGMQVVRLSLPPGTAAPLPDCAGRPRPTPPPSRRCGWRGRRPRAPSCSGSAGQELSIRVE